VRAKRTTATHVSRARRASASSRIAARRVDVRRAAARFRTVRAID
jgi:hypothetical protein